MPAVLQVDDRNGNTVLIETAPVTAAQRSPATVMRGDPSKIAEQARVSLDELLSQLGQLVRQVGAQVHEAAASAHEIRVEFGVKVSADAHVILAHAGGEATLQVSLTWRPATDGAP